MTGPNDLSDLKTIDQVVERARQVTAPDVHLWAAAGAGQEVTTSRNTLALNRLALVPRAMRDVAMVDISSSFVGIPISIPVIPAPIGALALYDPEDALVGPSGGAAQPGPTRDGLLASGQVHLGRPRLALRADRPAGRPQGCDDTGGRGRGRQLRRGRCVWAPVPSA